MKTLFLTSSIDRVVHDIAKKIDQNKYKKLVFITTAAEGEDGDKQWLQDDRQALINAGFTVTDYTITDKSEKQVQSDLASFDVIYVEGGHIFYLLEKMQHCNFANSISQWVKQDKFYIGHSAGSIVAGPDVYPFYRIEAVEKAPNLQGYAGLGLVDFVILPHWGDRLFKELYFNYRLKNSYTKENKIILLTDYQYLYVKDDWYQIVEVEKIRNNLTNYEK